MEIQEQRHGAVTVLRPRGPLGRSEADEFKTRVGAALEKSLGRFVVDVTAVPFVDSRGLEVISELSQELNESGQGLKLCGANETLREVFDLTDVGAAIEYYEDATSAVRSFL